MNYVTYDLCNNAISYLDFLNPYVIHKFYLAFRKILFPCMVFFSAAFIKLAIEESKR